jgi:FKBP-type peptidyl-prolyl cis-trans isomerase (trigger factor)
MDSKIAVEVERQPKSMVMLKITSDKDDLVKYTEKVFQKLSPNVAVQGFRKGKAPKKLIEESLGVKLFDEALNMLLTDLTSKALVQENINPLTPPEFHLEEFEPNKPISFHVHFAVYPTIEIGDVKSVKMDAKEVKLAQERRKQLEEEAKKPKEEKKKEVKEEKNDGKDTKEDKSEEKKEEEKKPPVFNLEKYYSEILDKVFAISKIEIPDALIDHDLLHQEENFTSRLQELGIKPEDYLKIQNLTIEQARENWRKDIEFSLKQDLLLSKYAKDNDLKADKKEVDDELAHSYTKEQIANLDPEMYNYVNYAILRQKAFLHLLNLIETNNANTNSH